MELKTINYKKIANIVIYFIIGYFIISQKDAGAKYFKGIKMVEFALLLIAYYYVRSKISKK